MSLSVTDCMCTAKVPALGSVYVWSRRLLLAALVECLRVCKRVCPDHGGFGSAGLCSVLLLLRRVEAVSASQRSAERAGACTAWNIAVNVPTMLGWL